MYGVQLERARVKYLVKEELEAGKGAVELGAPNEVEREEEKDGEPGERSGKGVEEGEGGGVGMESERSREGEESSGEKDG
jgi:hypothetical protein